jgi:membrane fusion protein (multidrug efflux system)
MKRWLVAILLIAGVTGVAYALGTWKVNSWKEAAAAAALMPEPMEVVRVVVAQEREYGRSTTTTGTVRALQSITLSNEIEGTVQSSFLIPGEIVESGTVLVAMDVSVEEAELKALEAQAVLTKTVLDRMVTLSRQNAVPEMELDKARAERDVALAQVSRTRAVMARKTLRAPFRARVGMADLHAGQYLEAGTELTTLQGVDEAVHVDFQVTQQVAESLRVDGTVEILSSRAKPVSARIVALDARINADTRNATVRARIESNTSEPLAPGAAVQVRVPVGGRSKAVSIPVRALRRGAEGDFLFQLVKDGEGKERATQVPVKVEALQGEEVLVSGAVKPGDRIAAVGSFKLREGILVMEAPPETAATDAAPGGSSH